MSTFVIKLWSADDQADGENNHVSITGRAGGFVSWLLNLLCEEIAQTYLHTVLA
jgi:hypothetical protein